MRSAPFPSCSGNVEVRASTGWGLHTPAAALRSICPRRRASPRSDLSFGRLINVSTNPTAEWIARQLTEAFPWSAPPRYLIRDRDRIYGSIVARRMRAMGIRDKPTAPASPWQNGCAERLIGSIRRECVDHFIVLGEAHLRHILRTYAHYYNDIRTHRSLDKDAPVSRPVQRIGSVNSHAILGGLHHHYVRI